MTLEIVISMAKGPPRISPPPIRRKNGAIKKRRFLPYSWGNSAEVYGGIRRIGGFTGRSYGHVPHHEYAQASALHVFGSSLGDPVADEILRAVRSAGQAGMTRTQIRDLFKRNCSAERLGAALDLLARRNLVRRRTQETGGRPSEVWENV